MINGTAKDALDYVEHQETGLKVIAIGGDKLARGLTLEGLSVSYFLRASRMYDTLMQMGRWFGYRPGYLDVCRLYTTGDLIEWFGHIADASEELRQEFDLMAESGGTPRDYGLRVQSHPVLMVTSFLKMRTARSLMLSFSGCILETVALYRDTGPLQYRSHVTANYAYLLPCQQWSVHYPRKTLYRRKSSAGNGISNRHVTDIGLLPSAFSNMTGPKATNESSRVSRTNNWKRQPLAGLSR